MSTRNIPGGKGGRAWGWPHHLHVPNVLKSWSLNLLEPSGPLPACNGTDLHVLLLSLRNKANDEAVDKDSKQIHVF